MTTGVIENLNRAQSEAVINTDGPMMIIAGAGTGKTRVITSRILHLLLDKKVPSGQILALTFTEKATEEMLTRVDSAMPLSYEGVTIKTFHGFCDFILREKGIEMGLDPSFKLINPAKQWLTVKKNLFQFELDYYRPLGNPTKFIHVLLGHFSRLKDEDISPEMYVKHAKATLESASDEASKEEAMKMLEIANAYETYQDLLMKNNFLDFGDLQYYALRLFEKCPSVLKYFQERFKYVLVDEFQDTNFAQNKLVMMLAKSHQNLTVVGDDDQSIYKWRGASLSNLDAFNNLFPNANKVVLTDNYRSSQQILDLSYKIVQNNNPDRLEFKEKINKRLVAKGDDAGENSSDHGGVEVRHFSHYLEEVGSVVSKIKSLMNGGVALSNIAILVRANQHAVPYIEAFKDTGIPFSVRDTQSLTFFEEIKNVVALLRFLAKPHDDVAFFRLMSMEGFDIPMNEILEIVKDAKKDDYKPMFYYLRDKFREDEGTLIPGFGEGNSKVFEVYTLFNQLLDFSRNHRISRIIGEFLDKSGYFKLLAKNENDNAEMLQRLAKFLEIAHDFEGGNNDFSISIFLDFIDSMEQARGLISESSFADKEAVSVLTVHSSKGLEFDYVFLPSLVAQRFPSTNKKDPIAIPDALIEEVLPESDSNINEERRLFYVACTRARKGLYLSYSDKYEGNKKWKMSLFLQEALDTGEVKEIEMDLQDGEVGSAEEVRRHGGLARIESKQEIETPHEQKIYSLPEVKVNQLSYSQIDTFKSCPLKYKFRYLFKIPTPSPHAANFGSSVHDAINHFYARLKDSAPPTMDLMMEMYENSWIGVGYESKAHENARKLKGAEMLENFFEAEKAKGFKIPVFMERGFRLKIGRIAFTGRIDRIDRLDDGTYEVIDYKTGASKRQINLKKDMQLSLYALACKEVFNIPVSALSLYFLEDLEKPSTSRTEEDLIEVKEEIKSLSDELIKSDYKPTPGFHCGYCEYRVLCNAAV